VARDDVRREEVQRVWEGLSPAERRERFFLRPAYRTARDRILDSEDRTSLPRYALSKWLPILGAEAFALWLLMRDMSRVEAARADSWCWPDQEELAARVGVSGNTVRKLLAVLEGHGFIRRERRRERVEGRWGEMQRTNRYEVFVDVPLVEADAVEALMADVLDEASRAEFRPGIPGKERMESLLTSEPEARANGPVDCLLTAKPEVGAADLNFCGQRNEGLQSLSHADLKSCARNVSNVANSSNVRETSSGKKPLREHPAVKRLTGVEKRERARLAVEIGETLQRMEGTRGGRAHHSLGFHRRVAFLMPPSLVQEALRATRDAVDDRRAGKGGVRQDPSQYFGGIVKQLALESGIDLGLKSSPERWRSEPTTTTVARRASGPRTEAVVVVAEPDKALLALPRFS